jgi:hypothetical protein
MKNDRLSGFQILAIVLIAIGIVGFLFLATTSVIQLVKNSIIGNVDNPLYLNSQKLVSRIGIEFLTHGILSHLVNIAAFTLLILALSVHYGSIISTTFEHSKRWSAIATIILSASTALGIVIGAALMLPITFAFQWNSVEQVQRDWLRTGMPFLIQIHLIFVYAWFFCTAIGWICIAKAVEPSEFSWMRKVLLSASFIILLSLSVRSFLTLFPSQTPAYIAVCSRLFGVGMGLGLFACGAIYLRASEFRFTVPAILR